jgi:hypothetical protein
MINNYKIKTSASLNNAFELILKIFDEERTYYQDTINSLKEKISELENTLLQVKKENMAYQTRITKLKAKLRSISKTVSKLEESDFEVKINSKDIQDNEINDESNNNININKSQFNTIKYRNTDTLNSFRKKSKIISDINNKSININNNTNHYLKMNLFDNNKLNNNGEDISRYYDKKTHKKTLSTKIKNSILNINHTPTLIKKRNGDNNMYKSQCYNDEDLSIFLLNNLNENELQNKMTVPIEKDKKNSENKKYIGRDKYNKIEQKIKGLKSALTIYNKQDSNKNSIESFPNSFNIQNIISK